MELQSGVKWIHFQEFEGFFILANQVGVFFNKLSGSLIIAPGIKNFILHPEVV